MGREMINVKGNRRGGNKEKAGTEKRRYVKATSQRSRKKDGRKERKKGRKEQKEKWSVFLDGEK